MQAVKKVREEPSDELAVIARRAQAFTHASGTAIALSEGNVDEIICRSRAGSSAPEVGTALRVEGTFTGLCIQSGRELRCDDAETDTRVDKAAIRALGIRSMVAIPIKEEGRVVGVLAVFAPTTHAFTITHVAGLKTIADQIAAYLERKQRVEAYSPEPFPAPPVNAAPVSATASPVPPPMSVIKPAAPASRPRQFPVIPKVEPVRASTLTGEMDPATFVRQTKTNRYHQQQESKTDVRPAFGTLDADAAPENRPGTKALMIGAAAVVVMVVAVGLSFKLRRTPAAPQPAVETSSSPGTGAAPAVASANVQPPAKNTLPAPPAKHEAAQPKREETVVLLPLPSRISLPQPANSARVGDPAGARDNSAPASDAPAISLDSLPASGSLTNLANPVSQSQHPRLLTQSELEPVTVIKTVPPIYPLVAKERRLIGSVVVQVTVDKNGRISDLQLISGPPLFRDAAFAAVKQWVFKPARLNGQAIEQSTKIRLNFGGR
ncbi:MAG TPA: TonB family protein [Candidatus Angelobacter sp.]|nr:TonB family protein [Candidatus Angelobacter sp.]